MKVFLLFLILLSSCSFGQLGREMDDYCESELHRIVLNYQKNGVNRFKVRYMSSFSYWRLGGKKYHYHMINDSTLIHRRGFEKQGYKIDSNRFDPIWTKEDSLEFVAFRANYFEIIKDSSGYTSTYYYTVKNNQDTVLTNMYAIKKAGDTLTEVRMWYNLSQGQKSILITFSDTSSCTHNWVYQSGQWIKSSEISTSIRESEHTRTITNRITQFGRVQGSNDKVSDRISIDKIEYTRDKRGLIRKIRYTETTQNLNQQGSRFYDKTTFWLSFKPKRSGG